MKKIIFSILLFLILGPVSDCFSQVNVEWFSTYGGGFGKNFMKDFVMDSLGNSYMTGNVSREQNNQIIALATVKFNSNGNLIWSKVFEGSFSHLAEGNAIILDNNGNICVTGVCTDSGSGENYCTIKYTASGDVIWIKKYSDNPISRDVAADIVCDKDDNIYITGYNYAGPPYFWSTLKYDSSGNQLWSAKFEGNLNTYKSSKKIILDSYNNIYVCGFISGSSGSSDFCTIKYDSAGKQQWITISDINNLGDEPSDLQIDNSGNLYILGQSYNNNGFFTSLLKYNNNGDEIWNAITDSTGENNGYYIRKNSFKLDQENKNIYIATTYRYYCCTIKYDSNGSLQWLSKYKSTEFPFSKGLGINIDRYGDIYTTGFTAIPVNVEPFLSLKYHSDGMLIWDKDFHVSNESEFDEGTFVGFDKSNNIYIAGIYVNTNLSSYKYSLLKYSQGVGITNISSVIPGNYKLYQNYPNPFNPETNIRFDISEAGHVILKVYNNLGKQVSVLVDNFKQRGSYIQTFNSSELSSGIYYYKLQAGNFSETKKMVVLK